MSGGLAPSKSTVYVSNLPFSLTNNDLHKILEKYGRIAKVTILKDRQTRLSKGVAFVLFLDRDSAHQCVRALNMSKMFGRTINCSIAKDNGRTTEFIKRKYYKDKSRCYECGEEGHLSYLCPNNLLGEREPPKKKKKRKYEEGDSDKFEEDIDAEGVNAYGSRSPEKTDDLEEIDEGEDPALESLASAIQFQQEKVEEEDYRFRVASGNYQVENDQSLKKKIYKKSGYFSDEEELDD